MFTFYLIIHYFMIAAYCVLYFVSFFYHFFLCAPQK